MLIIQRLHLSQIGDGDVGPVTRTILGAFMTNNVAKEFNWKGRGGKVAFQELRIKNVIVGKSYFYYLYSGTVFCKTASHRIMVLC